MKKFLVVAIIIFSFCNSLCAFALEADDSIDEIIKKTYNAEGSGLPKLPKTSPESIKSSNFLDTGKNGNTDKNPSVSTPKTTVDIPSVPQKVNVKTKKISGWKKVNVKFSSAVSDKSAKGTRVTLTSEAPLVTKNITLPAGTVFYGTVVNSHPPQMLGNGGLVSVKTEYVSYNGKTSYFDANIVSLNHEKVLFNNIKGKNGYIKGISKTIKPAKTFYNKSLNVSKKLWNSPAFIAAPVTYLPAAIFLAGDAAVSPFIAMFHKGDKIYIKSGTPAVIKLVSPAYVEY